MNSSGGGTNAGRNGLYDDVPKTSESNAAVFLIVMMIFAIMGIGYTLYMYVIIPKKQEKEK